MIRRLSETWKQQKRQENLPERSCIKTIMEKKRPSKNRSILTKSLLRSPIASSVSSLPAEAVVSEDCLISPPAKTMKTCKTSCQSINLGISSIEWGAGDSILNCIQDIDSENTNKENPREKSFTKVLEISSKGKSDDSDSDFVVRQLQKRRRKSDSPLPCKSNLLEQVKKENQVLKKVNSNIDISQHEKKKASARTDLPDKLIPNEYLSAPKPALQDSTLLMSAWGLPDSVLQTYKKNGIESMFPWQRDCLSTGKVLSGGFASLKMTKQKMNIVLVLVISMFSYTWEKTLKDYPSECLTANEIDDNTRFFKNHRVPTSSADDLDLEKGWYRVIGKQANSLKQGFDKALTGSRRSPPNFCGTIYAGALMGEHPTPDQGIVEMTVCFRSSFCFYENIKSCVCKYKKIIYVQNCLRHYIYWLTPTNNQARYCTGNLGMDGPLTVENRSYAIECNQYFELDDSSRVWDMITDVKSDNMEGWYRFSKDAGTELASGCTVSSSHLISRMAQPCGAAYRGYMPDRHPSLSEGRVSRRVCFSSATSCHCEFFTNIGVRNCGSFYVYRLQPPPIANSRYCGASKELLSVNQDVKKPTIEKKKGICEQYEVRHDPDRLWSFTSPTVKKCDAHFYGRYRFGSKYTPWSIHEGCNKTDMYIVTHRCGTTYQGFMEGRHPTVSEGYVERIICFQEASSPCECANTTIIGVQNCSGFYVYDIKGVPRCDSRFCMVANKTSSIRIDPGRPPLYDIPVPGVKTDSLTNESGSSGKSFITTTMLSICLLLVLIILIGFVLLLLFCIWPLYKDRKQGSKKYAKNNNIPLVNHHDHSDSGSNGRLPREQIKTESTELHSDNNNEEFLDLTIPPRPSNAPPLQQPFSPDLPPMPSDDEDDKCNKISPTSDISFPELPQEIKDEEHSDSEDYDTLLKKEDIHKPEPYSQFDSAV